MKDIKKTPSWPKVAAARAAWEAAPEQGKAAARDAYKRAVRQCYSERYGVSDAQGRRRVL